MESEKIPSENRINLFCPSLSKVATVVAWDHHRLDLGAIARTFGIDPPTLRINGHFISRGADLVASSVTWTSLLSFFSSRGIPTGTPGSPALLVDGKLSKSGAKRAHDPADQLDAVEYCTADKSLHSSNSKKMKMKMKENNPYSGCENREGSNRDGIELKRKLWLEVEAITPFKRSKRDGTYMTTFSKSETRKRVRHV